MTEQQNLSLKSVSPLISPVILRKFGMYASSSLGNDLYYLNEAIRLLVNDMCEDWLEERYKLIGKDWKSAYISLNKIDKLALRTKLYYDSLDDKSFSKKDKENIIKRFYLKSGVKIAIMQPTIYNILGTIIKQSNLQRFTIPPDAYKVLDQTQNRKIDMTRKVPQNYPQQTGIKIEREN